MQDILEKTRECWNPHQKCMPLLYHNIPTSRSLIHSSLGKNLSFLIRADLAPTLFTAAGLSSGLIILIIPITTAHRTENICFISVSENVMNELLPPAKYDKLMWIEHDSKITYRLHSLPIPFFDCISVCLSVYLYVRLSLCLAARMSIISIYQCLHWLTIWLTDYTKCTIYFQCHAKLFNLLLANSPKNNFLTHIKALTPWLIDWLIHSMTDWLADGQTDALAEWLTDRLTASICYRWWFIGLFTHNVHCTLYTEGNQHHANVPTFIFIQLYILKNVWLLQKIHCHHHEQKTNYRLVVMTTKITVEKQHWLLVLRDQFHDIHLIRGYFPCLKTKITENEKNDRKNTETSDLE